jgi:hypothetical protein
MHRVQQRNVLRVDDDCAVMGFCAPLLAQGELDVSVPGGMSTIRWSGRASSGAATAQRLGRHGAAPGIMADAAPPETNRHHLNTVVSIGSMLLPSMLSGRPVLPIIIRLTGAVNIGVQRAHFLAPSAANASARLTAVVLLPTPPLEATQ